MKKILIGALTLLLIHSQTPTFASGSYFCMNKQLSELPNVYTDLDHWIYYKHGWHCLDETYEQWYQDRWIETDGKWYFVNKFGYMAKDTWIIDDFKGTKYFVGEDGVWIPEYK